MEIKHKKMREKKKRIENTIVSFSNFASFYCTGFVP